MQAVAVLGRVSELDPPPGKYYFIVMRIFLFAIPLVTASFISTAAERESIEGTWAPKQVNLGEPSAMAALEERDPDGYRTVVRLVDLVSRFGCRGAFLGEIKALVKWEFIACGSMDEPPTTSRIGFWLGDSRYFVVIPPRDTGP